MQNNGWASPSTVGQILLQGFDPVPVSVTRGVMLYSTILPLCLPQTGLPGNLKISLQSATAFSQILRTIHLHLAPNGSFPAPYNAIESNNHPPLLLDLSWSAGTGFPLGLEVLSKWGHFSSATQNYLVSPIHEQAVHLRQWPSTSMFPGDTESVVTPVLLKWSSWDGKARHKAAPLDGEHRKARTQL